MTSACVSRPIVRYHGGKWRLADWIICNFVDHKIYVEPFGGGGSVLLKKERSYAEIYNDLDEDIVNLFRVARDQGDELREALSLTPYSRVEFNAAYSRSIEPLERARRTVVRAFMGFGSSAITGELTGKPNTGFRANSNRSGTTPAHDWVNYPRVFNHIIARLQGVCIENSDAIKVMQQHDSIETLHYVDPPYLASVRSVGQDYRHELTDESHHVLLRALRELKGKVIISGYRSGFYDDALHDWIRVDRRAFADGARARVECLYMNYSPLQPDIFARVVQ